MALRVTKTTPGPSNFHLKFDNSAVKLNQRRNCLRGEVPFAAIPCRTCHTARLSAHSLQREQHNPCPGCTCLYQHTSYASRRRIALHLSTRSKRHCSRLLLDERANRRNAQ